LKKRREEKSEAGKLARKREREIQRNLAKIVKGREDGGGVIEQGDSVIRPQNHCTSMQQHVKILLFLELAKS